MVKRVLRTREAAQYVGLSTSSLEKMRLGGAGPEFLRLGGGKAIGYDVRALDAWIDAQRGGTGSTATPSKSAV